MDKVKAMPAPAPVLTVENHAGVAPENLDYAVCCNGEAVARFDTLRDATDYRQKLSGAEPVRPWRDVVERLEAVSEALDAIEEPVGGTVEEFVRIELARQVEAARRIAGALAADEAQEGQS